MRMKVLLCAFITLVPFLVVETAAFLSQTLPKSAFGVATSQPHRCLEVNLSASPRDENEKAASLAREQEEWKDAVIISSRSACPSGKSTLIEVQVDEATHQAYTTPGQFVRFKPCDESTDPIFLAISSAPATTTTRGAPTTLQFLIKMAPRLTWLPETLVVGTTVKISSVMGSGFPLQRMVTDDDPTLILVAAAGSGIAPLKACIESKIFASQPPQQTRILYYGEWNEDDLCFSECFETWKDQHGVSVVPVLSRASDTRAYVQDVLQQQEGLVGDSTNAKSTWAILCGMDDMVESCTQVLTDAGVDDGRILLNL